MKKTTLFLLSLAVISVILIAGCTQPEATTLPAKPVSTSNVTLPGPGPLVGNWNVATQEAACAAAQKNSPWYPTLLSYEAADMGRSHMYPCAQFTGSLTGPNTVYAYKSTDNYYSGSMIVTRGTNDLYVYGGASGATPTPYGSYVAKINRAPLRNSGGPRSIILIQQGSGSGLVRSSRLMGISSRYPRHNCTGLMVIPVRLSNSWTCLPEKVHPRMHISMGWTHGRTGHWS